ncbi:DUF6210 family protein [Streptomyces acidiscabies]|uniref:DUF6210 family protein n=1 Tax=Streptomyces acidiscabies TaxID=42234 RepID=A0AAP6EF43_9ACTN|nr:DUF6210 family protein [Streptomyces acidiscabies]MBP5940777.1 hypothetical protein [Streptomyces sp. LBUM 1476]MBZ3912061.1 hypothetical protein [Streptomyces acidiscabies]MDX2959870.1 DUF6210 family protein [Streptomyces acidiscabies]MDX3022382.1 DUF6210 family protein [Streptomyces acidiscabies]MDX3792452.1 DUF6210 family protein [Streptomyces acidiscabies]
MTRRIVLDPEGSGTGWLCVIVAASTGVVYEVQGGGHACVPYEQEGYLIPLFAPDADSDLKRLFTEGGDAHDPAFRDRLRTAVADLRLYGSANRDDTWPARLALDEARLAEADEAWIPVLTPDGPGIVVWENSD